MTDPGSNPPYYNTSDLKITVWMPAIIARGEWEMMRKLLINCILGPNFIINGEMIC